MAEQRRRTLPALVVRGGARVGCFRSSAQDRPQLPGTLLWTAITEHRLRQKIFFHFPKNINAQLYFNSKCSDFVREGAAGLSPGLCVSACSGAGYSYAGLGGGRGCYCGHTHPRHQDRSHNQSDFYCLSLPFVALGPA